MEGLIADHPLPELIREIAEAKLSGALRLARGPAKIVIYFESGETVFTASNLRAHRLREAMRRSGMTHSLSAEISDEELAMAVIKDKTLTRDGLQRLRDVVAADVLRTTMLWTDGHWSFDQRVRLAGEARVKVSTRQLLLESARHLPADFLNQFNGEGATYTVVGGNYDLKLGAAEEAFLARANEANGSVRVSDLSANGLSPKAALRSAYGLTLAGVLECSESRNVLGTVKREKQKAKAASPQPLPRSEPKDEPELDVNKFLERVNAAKDHYEVLGVPRASTIETIKDSYHLLARRFHPDRFHQSSSELQDRIDSAFARVAQSYEVLSDDSRRPDYDKKLAKDPAVEPKSTDEGAGEAAPTTSRDRAETAFRQGMDALRLNQYDEAIKLLGEAASLEPRRARYRAHYGFAMSHRANLRRNAETELQAAVALEPNNSSFHLMLAELYQMVGLRSRAQNEAARALAADPSSEAARLLLSKLKQK